MRDDFAEILRLVRPRARVLDVGCGEGELLELLSHGGSTVDAAAALGVSVNTVKTRLRRLYAKLGVHDREAALKAAARLP